jgi:hypothetical protein
MQTGARPRRRGHHARCCSVSQTHLPWRSTALAALTAVALSPLAGALDQHCSALPTGDEVRREIANEYLQSRLARLDRYQAQVRWKSPGVTLSWRTTLSLLCVDTTRYDHAATLALVLPLSLSLSLSPFEDRPSAHSQHQGTALRTYAVPTPALTTPSRFYGVWKRRTRE